MLKLSCPMEGLMVAILTMRVLCIFMLMQKRAAFSNAAAAFVCISPTSRQLRNMASSSLASLNMAITASPISQLAQLASVTTLSIDSGDLAVIEKYADTGYVTDATTNPLFVSQAGLNADSNPIYAKMVNDAVDYAINQKLNDISETVSLAIDRLAVNLGKSISKIVRGYVSTEVDPRLSFDTEASVQRALRIIAMYEEIGITKDRILIKLAATWEGIKAAEILERDYNVQCNLTLIFSFTQGVACAQYGAHLVSPFPGRILDWYNTKLRRNSVESADLDEGVIACKDIYNYYKIHGHDTICMPASWRPSRGSGFALDEIRALAGTDRMTIPAPLLELLASNTEPLERELSQERAMSIKNHYPEINNGKMSEAEFRYRLNMDGCGTEKLAEGIRSFISETEKLEAVMMKKVREALETIMTKL